MRQNDHSSDSSYFCRFSWKLSCNSTAAIRKHSLHLICAEKSLVGIWHSPGVFTSWYLAVKLQGTAPFACQRQPLKVLSREKWGWGECGTFSLPPLRPSLSLSTTCWVLPWPTTSLFSLYHSPRAFIICTLPLQHLPTNLGRVRTRSRFGSFQSAGLFVGSLKEALVCHGSFHVTDIWYEPAELPFPWQLLLLISSRYLSLSFLICCMGVIIATSQSYRED